MIKAGRGIGCCNHETPYRLFRYFSLTQGASRSPFSISLRRPSMDFLLFNEWSAFNSVQNNPCACNEHIFCLTLDDKRLYLLEYWSTGVLEKYVNAPLQCSRSKVWQILSKPSSSTDFNNLGHGFWTGVDNFMSVTLISTRISQGSHEVIARPVGELRSSRSGATTQSRHQEIAALSLAMTSGMRSPK